MKTNVPQMVNATIQHFLGTDSAIIMHADDPFARAAMWMYLEKILEDGGYQALTKLGRDKFIEKYGSYSPV